MSSKLDHALALAAEGFHVFPLIPGSKLPHIDDYPNRATRDPEQIRRWWTCPVMGTLQDFNIAISTTRYQDDSALLVVDVDNKGDKHGDDTVAQLKAEGLVLPITRETRTPTGGCHLFYRVDVPVKQGAGVLGEGVDVRSRGGYVVGPGSLTDNGGYVSANDGLVLDAPAWLIEKCGTAGRDGGPSVAKAPAVEIDADRADRRALDYLAALPPAGEGERNHKGFAAAAKLKDFGVTENRAIELLQTNWSCSPPLAWAEIKHVVRSAYRYGREAPGSAAPEAQFAPVPKSGTIVPTDAEPETLHPFKQLNAEYAYVLIGGDYAILHETTDENGKPVTKYLSPGTFKTKFPGIYMPSGKKQLPIAQAWLDWPQRRSYDGLVFAPGGKVPTRFYNLWRGFSVEPWPRNEKPNPAHQKALAAFIEHTRKNVCRGDEALTRWLLGFFAHLVQRPDEKPLVALVFRGSKGVGKNAVVERVGALIDAHFSVAANRRYLAGQFNSHLEHTLFMVFNEAFWSGDKQIEGMLKELITEPKLFIERKGYEPYKAANRMRVAIIGNEDWLVPASHDERRYAVFDIGEGRKQDRPFFQAMREGMERGGYRLLLRYLLDFDLTGIDLNEAPATQGLLDQKHASLGMTEEWWLECLRDGKVVGGDFDGWPETSDTDQLRQAFSRHAKERGIRSRLPEATAIGRALSKCAGVERKRVRHGDKLTYAYSIPALGTARDSWERYIGHRVEWEK
jgi:hypothetical protein